MEAVLSLGSNSGGRHKNVASAAEWLKGILGDFEMSGLYETPAVGGGKSPYINCVVRGDYDGTAAELDSALKLYELRSGRDAAARARGEVPVDIDIVVFDGEVLRPRDYAQSFFRIGAEELMTVG